MIRCILVLSILLTVGCFANAMTEEEVNIVTSSVLELCRGGTSGETHSSIQACARK